MSEWTPIRGSFLNLPGILEGALMEKLGNAMCAAKHTATPDECPNCHQSESFHVHDKSKQVIHDMPISGKRVVLVLERTRWKCPVCGKTWVEPLDPLHFHEKRSVTTRLWQHVREFVFEDTFTGLALELGVDDALVRRMFLDYKEEMELNWKPPTPHVLGIDEVHLAKKARGILINLETGKPIDLLQDATRLTFTKRLMRMPDRDRVRIVTMDQTAYFRRLAREFFPNATVIADKWHILTRVDKALGSVRIAYRDKLPKEQRAGLFGDRWVLQKRYASLSGDEKIVLEAWTANHPTIGLAYALKEAFYNLYDLKDRAEAERQFEVWKKLITADVKPFRVVARSVDRWHDQVFAYFSHGRYTNARTEQVNGTIKAMQRDGRGYGFEILRAKFLFKEAFSRPRRVDAKADGWVPFATG